MNTLAPIVLFVYNRPWHTLQTLEALSKNDLANQSILYIYADGAKANANNQQLTQIDEVRKIIRQQQWCAQVNIIESEKNKGLADSIIDGVATLVNQYGKIIVLEDDLVTSVGFLRYMNEALQIYENEPLVMHVSGYMFPVKAKMPQTFFYNSASCWGWATWKRAWNHLNTDALLLLEQLYVQKKMHQLNIDGTTDYQHHLEENIAGNMKTWAVKWHASICLANGFCLHPYKSLVKNIGFDGSGIHCNEIDKYDIDKLAHDVKVKPIAIKQHKRALRAIHRFNNKSEMSLKKRIGDLFPKKIIHHVRLLINQQYKLYVAQEKKLNSLPRFIKTIVNFDDVQLKIDDIKNFNYQKDEIFKHQIYKFKTDTNNPLIIDLCANIGLTAIYFKKQYPLSSILLFENNLNQHAIIKENIALSNLQNIHLISKEEETLTLQTYFENQIDFLKIEILNENIYFLKHYQPLLSNVKNLFIKYLLLDNSVNILPELLTIIINAGFRYYIDKVGISSLQPFLRVNKLVNVQNELYIFCYRT